MASQALQRILGGNTESSSNNSANNPLDRILRSEGVSSSGFPVPQRSVIEPEEAGIIGGFIEGYRQPERGQIYEEVREGRMTMPEAQREIRYEGLEPQYKSPGLSFNPITLAKTALYTAGNFAGQMLGTAKEVVTDPTYLAEIGVGAGVGSIVPGVGTLAGAGYGAALAAFDSIRNQTSGNLYAEMVNNGVDEQTADRAAFVGGALSAALELAQFGVAGKIAAKGFSKLTREAAEMAISKAVGKKEVAKRLAAIVGKQAVEGGATEGAQEFSQQFIEETAKIFAEEIDGSVKEKTTWKDAFKSSLQAGAEAALGGGVLGGLSSGAGVATGAMTQKTTAMEDIGTVDGKLEGAPDIPVEKQEDAIPVIENPISPYTKQAIADVQRNSGVANKISQGIFGKKVDRLSEEEGATVLNVLNTPSAEIKYEPLVYPEANAIEAVRLERPKADTNAVIKSLVAPRAISALGAISNNQDVSASIRKKAYSLLKKVSTRKVFSETFIDELDSSIKAITEQAVTSSKPLALQGSLKDLKDDMVNASDTKMQETELTPEKFYMGSKLDRLIPGWAKSYVGSLANLSTRLGSALGTDKAREVVGNLIDTEEKKHLKRIEIETPVKKDLQQFVTSAANTPVMSVYVGDKKVNLSPNNMAMIYAISRMTDASGSNISETGGMTILRNHGFKDKDIQRVYNVLKSPEYAPYREAVERIQEHMGEQWNPVNELYSMIEGKPLGRKKTYFHVNFLEPSQDADIGDTGGIGRFGVVQEIDPTTGEVSKSFLQKSQNTKRRIQNLSFYDSVNKYYDEVAHYLAFAPIMHDFKRIFDDTEFRAQMEENIGKKEFNDIIRDIDDIRNNGTRMSKSPVDRIAHAMIGRMVKAVLYYPSVWVGQFSGIFSATGTVDGGLAAMPRTLSQMVNHPIEAYADFQNVVEKVGWFNDRARRKQSDYERLIRSDENLGTPLSSSVVIRGAQIGATKADNLAAEVTTYADLFANFVAYKSMMEAQIRDGVKPEQASKEAVRALEKSQPTASLVSKSRLFKQQGTWVEMLTRLKQQDNKSYNQILEAFELIKEARNNISGEIDISKMSRAKQLLIGQALNKLTWIASTALTTTLFATALGTTDEPEEKLKRSILYKTMQSITGAVPGLDLAGDIIMAVAQGRDAQVSMFMPTDPIAGIARIPMDLASGSGVSPSSVRDLGSMLGMPRIYSEPIAASVTDRYKKRKSRTRPSRRRRRT